ncbi:MAG: four helix bundle protein [Gemmataceae bacterium]|nr:four helix bundle protein [Gemmataceae bacterium]
MTPDELLDRLVDFAARIGKLVDALPDTHLGRHVAGQIVRSGTSPAPNYAEACAAESRADFVHKLKVVLKELRETNVWLLIIIRADLLRESRVATLTNECKQLSNIFGKIVTTKGLKPKREN